MHVKTNKEYIYFFFKTAKNAHN